MARYSNFTHFRRTSIATAAALVATHVLAQNAPAPAPAPTTQLEAVTVTGRAAPAATVSGWGDIPIAKTPLQASVFNSAQLRDLGVQRLSDLTGVDPSVSDAYNAEGYWDYLTVRGFVIDNRYNFRRDGLPINAETSIPLDNKAGIEILKGTSGMQAGTSAPGGLVNFVVKRPLDTPLRSASLEWRQPGSVTGAVDISQRFGEGQAFGVRVNAAAAHLDPMVRDLTGERHLFAIAADWRMSPDSLLEAEFENSRRSQPSQPGFSMLGNLIPAPGDPRINLNNQPWSLPVVFNANTASLRWQQKLGSDWKLVAHAMLQRLRSDDRLAYPFGCSKDGNFDRYCSDGTFDYYDFQSDNERRSNDALDVQAQGRFATGSVEHHVALGATATRFRLRTQPQADDNTVVGTGSVDGLTIVPSLPAGLGLVPNSTRTERSTELYVRDRIELTKDLGLWLGLRHTRLNRESVQTDGSRLTSYPQSLTTPWIAMSYAFAPNQLVYASWGQGVESLVVANRPNFTNAGQVLPALKSRQTEIGIKGSSDAVEWTLAAFDIQQPKSTDFCDANNNCTTQIDGTEHHRGIEADAAWRGGAWTLRGGTQWLHARREGSATPSINGLEPTNVPALTLKLQAAYDVAAIPGLNLQATLQRESRRMVLPDNSAAIPAFTVVNAALRYDTKAAGAQWTWRVGIDNLFDKRAWRESPYEFGHVYLYPVAPRTLRLSVQVDI